MRCHRREVPVDDFGEFYMASKDMVFRAIVATGGNRAGAEDAVAEAYARACARWSSVRHHPNPTAWVLRTALNVQRSWWRQLRREVPGGVPERSVTAAVELDEPGLRGLIATLPRRQREVVALRVLADLSPEQTAELL